MVKPNVSMMNPYIMTDTHLYHEKCKMFCNRPDDVDEKMTKNMIAIPKNSVFIHLGDYSWNPGVSYEKILKNMDCKKILVRGNHDKNTNSWFLRHGWDFVCMQFKDEYFGKKILFSHKPQAWDGWYDYNIHGHFHNLPPERWELELTKIYTDRHVLLSPELTGYKPISLNSIVSNLIKEDKQDGKNQESN